jgi:leader peptidase (prepilin peptidase) / N-methyltransferase
MRRKLAIIPLMITYIPLAILAGWLAGMLVNYLADVLPLRRKLTRPFCIACDTSQSWLNYLVWPRRCPNCDEGRSWRVWVVEVFYILASILLVLYPPFKVGYLLGLLVLAYFGVVVLIDMQYRLIMHPVSLAGVVIGLIVGVLRVGWVNSLLGGVIGFVIMGVLYLGGVALIRVVGKARGRPVNDEALGFGDVNLSGVLGLMLGSPLIIYALVVAVLIGGVVSLIYLVFKLVTRQYQAFMALPYGPFLVLGAGIFIYLRDVLIALMGK